MTPALVERTLDHVATAETRWCLLTNGRALPAVQGR